ncbi:MAG: hypothetical protein GY694_07020 [Gammaproteobacteria bacterium]|nr:hypothetical protein [Gammaproteobacteria bacterium]
MNDIVNSAAQIQINQQRHDLLEQNLVTANISLPITGMSHMEIQLTNWGQAPDQTDPAFLFSDLELGDEIEISMGLSELNTLFKGEITALEELFGQGAPQLIILAEDKLHRLARLRNSNSFEEMSINDIAENLISDIGISSDIQISEQVETFNQINESNLACLLRLGQRYNIHLRLEEDALRMRAEEEDVDQIEYDLQQDISYARIIADLNHQPRQCQNYGWNLSGDTEVSTQSQPSLTQGKTASDFLNDLGWGNTETTPSPFPVSQSQGEAFSQARFNQQTNHFVNARITCIGDARLRSGKQIKLSGGSNRFNGLYRIINCQHHFDRSNGYESHLLLEKSTVEEVI